MWTSLVYVAPATVALAIAGGVYLILEGRAPDPPDLGQRGLRRTEALRGRAWLAFVDPTIRRVASWVRALPLTRTRAKLDRRLRQAGDWLGLTADEVLAFSCLGFVAGCALGLFLTGRAGLPPYLSLFLGVIGASAPISRLNDAVTSRAKTIARTLPAAIDLAAMSMAAGLDFAGAMREIVEKTPARDTPLREEFSFILRDLSLGRTRRQALEAFAERVPSEAVRDFVGTVVQSEEKGHPLSEVLRVQGQMLRMRRSVLAEEAAARAGVKMLLPLVCIFIATLVLLMGPSMLKLMEMSL